MKKYTQRELINEISWSGVGKGIGRAGLGLLRSISPTAGKLVDKLIKVDDNKTYGAPMDAAKATIKYLLKSGQLVKQPPIIKEINATQYTKMKQASLVKTSSRSRNFDLNQSKRTKYYYVGYNRPLPTGTMGFGKPGVISTPDDIVSLHPGYQTFAAEGDLKDMLFTVVQATALNKLETLKWKVEKVEDATPRLPSQQEGGNTTPDTKTAVSGALVRKAARPTSTPPRKLYPNAGNRSSTAGRS